MAIEVTLPRQGWTMEEATFVEWLKKDGDEVRVGEPLFSVETEKAVQEIESLDEGILRLMPKSPKPGDTVKVAEVLGFLLAQGEAMPTLQTSVQPASADEAKTTPTPSEVSQAQVVANKADIPKVSAGCPVSPRAARFALQAGVDLRTVQGTGKGGRIRESDVIATMKGKSAPVAAIQPVPGIVEKTSTLRRTIAERMHHSKTITAPVTLTARIDAGALVALRDGLKAKGGKDIPAYGDIIMREVAQALLEHSALCAQWENNHIRHPDSVNIGFAVDTDAGLVVPVVHNAAKCKLPELAVMTKDLAERAKSRHLALAEMAGGTFTITNLGMLGIDAFTPIINWPECAVLGLGRITEEPVVNEKKLEIGYRMWLSLTFDHRVVDGAPAARFMESLRVRLEHLREG